MRTRLLVSLIAPGGCGGPPRGGGGGGGGGIIGADGPESVTVRCVTSSVIDTALTKGNAAAFNPCTVTRSPGLIANAICVDRSGADSPRCRPSK